MSNPYWPFPTELPPMQPAKQIPFNPNNHEESPYVDL